MYPAKLAPLKTVMYKYMSQGNPEEQSYPVRMADSPDVYIQSEIMNLPGVYGDHSENVLCRRLTEEEYQREMADMDRYFEANRDKFPRVVVYEKYWSGLFLTDKTIPELKEICETGNGITKFEKECLLQSIAFAEEHSA